jgi:hypothetical protein
MYIQYEELELPHLAPRTGTGTGMGARNYSDLGDLVHV